MILIRGSFSRRGQGGHACASDPISDDRRTGLLVDAPEEADVFDLLKMGFVPPADRDDRKWLAYVKAGVA